MPDNSNKKQWFIFVEEEYKQLKRAGGPLGQAGRLCSTMFITIISIFRGRNSIKALFQSKQNVLYSI